MRIRKLFVKIIGKLNYHNITIVRLLDYCFPKDEKLFIFGSYLGKQFKDNAFYFFDYLSRNHKDIKTIIFSTDYEIRKDINEKYGRKIALDPFSMIGLFYALRASVVIISFTLGSDIPISYLFSSRKKVINFWHGIPMKGIFLSDAEWTEKNKKIYLKKEAARYSLFPCSSKMEKLISATSFGVPYDKIPITGTPRNDYLFHYLHNQLPRKMLIEYFPNISCHVRTIMLYAPTKRENCAPKFFPFEDFNLSELNEFLIQNNILLVLRAHSANFMIKKYGIINFDDFKGYDAIRILNNDKVDNVNDILADIDILITDYSGIYWDFLLLNRPVVFIPYDIKEYEKCPGLLFDYDLIIAGPKVNSQKGFIQKITEYIADPSIDSEKRIFIRDLFHRYFDGEACNRIFSLAMS